MKRVMTFAVALTAGLCVASLADAAAFSQTGQVLTNHLNRTVPTRGACTRLNPPLPGTGWACVYRPGNPLYNEMNDQIRQAAKDGTTCSISGAGQGFDGHNKIDVLECPTLTP